MENTSTTCSRAEADAIYDASLVEFRKASRAFRVIQEAYRARVIGDAEYLAGRAAFDEAMRISDLAESRYIETCNS